VDRCPRAHTPPRLEAQIAEQLQRGPPRADAAERLLRDGARRSHGASTDGGVEIDSRFKV
jgi:hypothetical protein